MKKYSNNFERDFNWYLKVRHNFTFDGRAEREILYDADGVDGKKAFHIFDSTGKTKATRHPNLLKSLIKTKGSVNFHIKLYAEDRASGLFPLPEFQQLCNSLGVPDWFYNAVERQKFKYYKYERNKY